MFSNAITTNIGPTSQNLLNCVPRDSLILATGQPLLSSMNSTIDKKAGVVNNLSLSQEEDDLAFVRKHFLQLVSGHFRPSRRPVTSDPVFIDDLFLAYLSSVLLDDENSVDSVDDELDTIVRLILDYCEGEESLDCLQEEEVRDWVKVVQEEGRRRNEDFRKTIECAYGECQPSNQAETKTLKPSESKVQNEKDSYRSEETSKSSIKCGASQYIDPHVKTLQELFPTHSISLLNQALKFSRNNVELAIEYLVDVGNQVKEMQLLKNGKVKDNHDFEYCSKSEGIKSGQMDGNGMLMSLEDKQRIFERYGFVDKEAEQREYRPVMPKEEPKKMVRYREGVVVSTKGERYTEVAIGKDGEETPVRTYISKREREQIMNNRDKPS